MITLARVNCSVVVYQLVTLSVIVQQLLRQKYNLVNKLEIEFVEAAVSVADGFLFRGARAIQFSIFQSQDRIAEVRLSKFPHEFTIRPA